MNVVTNTKELLRHVSQRLSGREDCKQLEYEVEIGQNQVRFHPDIYTYRDMHHRSDKDRFRVADLILHKYYSQYIIMRDIEGNLLIDTSGFLEGIYRYQLSVKGKRRRWINTKSLIIM